MRVLSVACMVLMGCASSPEVLTFTFEGPDDIYAEALQAADDWSHTCGVAVIVDRNPGGVPMRVAERLPRIGRRDANGSTETRDGELVEVLIRVGAQDRPGTIAHEIGHALGVEHRDHGVMKAPHELGARVTKSDCEGIDEKYR